MTAPPKNFIAALDALFEPFNRSDKPGLLVGVAREGALIYRRALGMASLEHGVANTVRTRMRIGSVSKHFASLAALLLAEEGKLDLDVGVQRYVPEFQTCEQPPTLRQLMTHTAGLRDSVDLGLIAAGLAVRPKGDGLATQLRQSDVNFPPGRKMIYSNSGYQLLSLVVERVAGMQFESFLKQRLFQPLGMHNTSSVPSDFEIHAGVATLHMLQPDGSYRRGMFPSEEVRGEGAIISTVDDMLRWLSHLRGPHLVGNASSWLQLLAPARLANGRRCAYSLGLQLEPYRGLDVIQHGGTVIGGNCHMLTVPSHGLDVILMGNGAAVSVAELATKIVEAALGEEAFPQAPEQHTRTSDFFPLIGTRYATPCADLVLAFSETAGNLALSLNNSPALPWVAEDGALTLPFIRSVTGPYRLALTRLLAGDPPPERLALDDAGGVLELQRLPGNEALVTDLGRALLGRYRCADLDANACIELDGDALLLRIASEFGPSVLQLTSAYSDEVFAWAHAGPLAPMGGTLVLERTNGRVDGLRLNTLRTRHLHFQRLDDGRPVDRLPCP